MGASKVYMEGPIGVYIHSPIMNLLPAFQYRILQMRCQNGSPRTHGSDGNDLVLV